MEKRKKLNSGRGHGKLWGAGIHLVRPANRAGRLGVVCKFRTKSDKGGGRVPSGAGFLADQENTKLTKKQEKEQENRQSPGKKKSRTRKPVLYCQKCL